MFQRRAVLGGNLGHQIVDLPGGEAHTLGRQLHPVELRRQLDQRLIAPRAHISDDRGHRIVHILRLFALGAQQGGEVFLETGIRGVQKMGHGNSP